MATYSFNADGRRIPVEQIAALRLPARAADRLDRVHRRRQRHVRGRRATTCSSAINDLSVGEERVGQVTGTLALRGDELSGEIDAASPRLTITGTGRIALDRRRPTPS